jgi:hypothetical protein
MSDWRWSPNLQALLAKAKVDTPSGAARAKMWASISTAVGGAAGASGVPHPHVLDGGPPGTASLEGTEAGANAIAGGSSAIKMLAIGTLLGGTAAVGLTLAMLHVGAATASTKLSTQFSIRAMADGTSSRLTTPPSDDVSLTAPPSANVLPASPERGRNDEALVRVGPMHASEVAIPGAAAVRNVRWPQDDATAPARAMVTRDALSAADGTSSRVTTPPSADVSSRLTMPPSVDVPSAPPKRGQSSTVRARSTPPRSTLAIDRSDSLTREASFLAEARAALLRGDAKSALRKVRAARSLPVRQLVPEELSVEAQTLRALDRASEALEVERTLRTKYPESALAR